MDTPQQGIKMDINELVQLQIQMDESHGFPVSFKDVEGKYNQLTKDLVGLFGEIGEFSNIVKKINIHLIHRNDYHLSIEKSEQLLKEELTDCLIYLLRLSAILEMNLEKELFETMRKNSIKYGNLKNK